MKARLSAIQMTSAPDPITNLAFIEKQLVELPKHENHLVVLPECCLFFGGRDKEQLDYAQAQHEEKQHLTMLAQLAKQNQVNLVAGSVPVYQPSNNKFANTSIVFDTLGQEVSRYEKIHLFDVQVDDSEKNYLESKYTQAGKSITTAKINELTLGLAICYDLRFPELFRHLKGLGANVITLPSAFTRVTGKAHWQALLQARAIENQVFVVAAGQVGTHANGRQTYGHSMIISPWGEILSCLPDKVGNISVEVNLQQVEDCHNAMPVSLHNAFKTKFNYYE